MDTEFESHRRYLLGVAYRMLGSVADAEDAVQDAWLRWHRAGRDGVDDVRAYLTRVVTRLCLDRLRSARQRREEYVGPWLPEPLIDHPALIVDGPEETARDVSIALLMTLERLSPLERAAFILHDVFDMDYAGIATALGRGEAACRQLVSRARAHVHAARPRFDVSGEENAAVTEAFLQATETGDVSAIAGLLAGNARLYTDGGGKLRAALNPISGADRIFRFFAGVARKGGSGRPRWSRRLTINGMPGMLLLDPYGLPQTVVLETANGLITAIYITRNPDKLRHLAALLPEHDPAARDDDTRHRTRH
ncbi:MAG: sigma-70 family RNA polymerase sigma factor [Azospirillaceae bacterium]